MACAVAAPCRHCGGSPTYRPRAPLSHARYRTRTRGGELMAPQPQLFEGKRVLVFGVANERSIAWGITRALQARGARIALTYLNEVLEKRVRPLGAEVEAELILPCDVSDEAQVRAVFEAVREQWGGLDVLVHSIA